MVGQRQPMLQPLHSSSTASTTQRFMSSGGSGSSQTARQTAQTPNIQHVSKPQMEEILEGYHEGGRQDSGYVVMDVRTDAEVLATGKLGPDVYTLPVQLIMQSNVFHLEPDTFEDVCGFAKPEPDETLVFTCAAGVRSVYACQFAAQAGYSKLVNYAGGANEWFASAPPAF